MIFFVFLDWMEDGDSLFGSPPPSPSARGRSPSPALALPSAASSGLLFRGFGPSAQNVGTIALPGSHTISEPSIDTIATNNTPGALPKASVQLKKSTQAHKQPQKPKPTTPRPPPPPIPFPDPSQPPPSHFLRNQEALLGHAGLIAGIKPSKLTILPTVDRGAGPSNPIVLDDRETEIPRRPSGQMGRSNMEYFKNLHPSQLPTPTTQEVVDMLIKLKDIFPVLQSILKLLVSGGATQGGNPTSTTSARGWASQAGQRRITVQPLVKRRKLNRVPAGAADWDVPYPFLDGEGPEAYRQNWTKDRSRQLIAQLIGLVRAALEKATAKKYLDELARRRRLERNRHRGCSVLMDRQLGGKGANHYRDPIRDALVSSTLHNTVEISPNLPTGTQDPSVALTSTSTPASSNTTFNDLLSTLLSVPDPTQYSGSSQTLAPSHLIGTDQSTNNLLAASHVSSSTNEVADQSLVDSWMNILQTFSLSADASITNDGNLLDFLSGIDPPADLSTYTSGDISPFPPAPNPEGQQPLDFSNLDFNQMGNLDLALDLIANGSTGATTGQVGAFADGNFDLSIPCDNPERSDVRSAPLSDVPIDLDRLIREPQNILTNAEQLPLDINTLLDPRLLAMSSPYTSGIQSVLTLSNSFPSPPSTLGPVTPTSADRDVTLPRVVIEGQSPIQGTRHDGPLTLVSMTDVNYGKRSWRGASHI